MNIHEYCAVLDTSLLSLDDFVAKLKEKMNPVMFRSIELHSSTPIWINYSIPVKIIESKIMILKVQKSLSRLNANQFK